MVTRNPARSSSQKAAAAALAPRGEWAVRGMLYASFYRKGATLVVTIEPQALVVLAIETKAKTKGNLSKDIKAVFDQHAHQVIGNGTDLIDAIRIGTEFAGKWCSNNLSASDCACPTIKRNLQ